MKIFTFLYELFWSPANPAYRSDIFPMVGVTSTITVLLLALIFYLGLGRWQAGWHHDKHWTITLVILIVFNAIILLSTTIGSEVDFSPFDLYLLLINSIYIVVFWMIFSAIFKQFSVLAKKTPNFLP